MTRRTTRKTKEVKIDFDGIEARASPPHRPRVLRPSRVANDGKLIYARYPARGSTEPSAIKIFDPAADEKEEKNVVTGAGGYDISADGKKLLVFKGGSMSVVDAAAAAARATDRRPPPA